MITRNRTALVVGLVAAVVYAGALRNGFTGDDGHIILGNPLVHSASGMWRAFLSPYWPAGLGGTLYRPLAVASYAFDWAVGGGAVWFHFVNVLWHVAASVLVALLAYRSAGCSAALLGGLLFAVHPVHVEAVASIVGRAELMATTFTLLAVYLAVERGSVAWSALAWGLGLFSKESAGIAPVLVAVAWWAGVAAVPRPGRRQLLTLAAAWGVVGATYLGFHYAALHQTAGLAGPAPVFVGQTFLAIRLTALSEVTDLARLMLFPLHLRADYSPAERTIVTSALDPRLLLAVAILACWTWAVVVAWRRRFRVEAFGLFWVGLAYISVSNLIVPIGVLMAERTLYLSSAGLALAIGAAAVRVPVRPLVAGAAAVLLAGVVRTATRVPVWRDNLRLTLSVLEDSPRSYQGPMASAGIFLEAGHPEKALDDADSATAIFPLDPRPYLIGAHAALKIGRMATADSLLVLADRHCFPCGGVYEAEAAVALAMRDSAIADSLRAHLRRRGVR